MDGIGPCQAADKTAMDRTDANVLVEEKLDLEVHVYISIPERDQPSVQTI